MTDSAASHVMKGFNEPVPSAADMLAANVSAVAWQTRQLPPQVPLLGSLITATTRAFIGGPTGIGKTQLEMAMAAGLATGTGFLHWPSARPARVLILDGEMPRGLLQERLRDAVRRQGGGWRGENLFVVCQEDGEDLCKRFPELGTFAPLNTEARHAFVLKLAEMLKPDVIFFDNRMSLLVGDMKDEVPWTDTMPLVKELTGKSIAQVWFDHTGHAGDRIYGSKTKEWSFDTVILLEQVANSDADVAMRLIFQKTRRRTPSNRADFENVTITLRGDIWAGDVTGAGGAGASRSKAKEPPATARKAATILQSLIAERGEPLPQGGDYPSAPTRAVTREAWFTECKLRGLSTSDVADNQRRVIDRAIDQAVAHNLVAVRTPFCWTI